MWILIGKLALVMVYPLGVTVCLLLVGWFFHIRRARRVGAAMIFTAAALLIVTSTPRFAQWALGSLESRYPPLSIEDTPQAGLIVLLGGSLALPLPPRVAPELIDSADRVLHAARLYRAGKAPVVFLSGGNVFPEFHPRGEAHYVAELLQEWGVDPSAIHLEQTSRNTYQNAVNTKAYLERKGWLNEKIILVTSASHMARAVAVFKAADMPVIPSATDFSVTLKSRPGVFDWLPSAGALAASTRAWHEYLGLWIYRLRGWA